MLTTKLYNYVYYTSAGKKFDKIRSFKVLVANTCLKAIDLTNISSKKCFVITHNL